MDLIKEALSMGFANAAIMDTKDLVFVPEYRQFCEDNMCGNYNLVPACPPAASSPSRTRLRSLPPAVPGSRSATPSAIRT
jgi:predicted metal-binding protein